MPPSSSIDPIDPIDRIRAASRQLVRRLGFMGGAFAGTDLSPSAVHALIEIEATEGMTASVLGERLRLEKSSVSRMLRKLVLSGDVVERASEADGRAKCLFLGPAGRQRVARIHRFARKQVSDALSRLGPGEGETVVEGLRLYAGALASDPADGAAPAVEIARGYRPGLIGRITAMHARFYAREAGFGQSFEAIVASSLAEFCVRLDNPSNAVWTASRAGEIVGAIAIDGEERGPGLAHLRWFIVDDAARGEGVGARLLDAALSFVDEMRFPQTHLWTFSGLDAARRLYEARGFACVEERTGSQWGREVLEQRFARTRPT